jgi:AAA domain
VTGPGDELAKALHGPEWEPPPPEAPPGERNPFQRERLGDGISRKRPRPRTLDNLLYPRKLHSVAGEPGCGKTGVALWFLLRVMSLGYPVMMVDEEAGADQTMDLLSAFGADSAATDKLFHYYPFPGARWMSEHDLGMLHKTMAEVSPVLAVFDSTSAMLSAAGLSENDPGDVTRFWNKVLLPLGRQFGCAVLVTDHDSKDGMTSRYARGTTAKLAVVDVAFKLSAVTRYTRDQDGLLEFRVTKDRLGCLHENWQVTVTRDPLTFAWAKGKPPGPAPRRGGGMAPGKTALRDALDGTPATVKHLVDRIVAAGGKPLRADTANGYLNELAAEELADKIDQGQGQAALWAKPVAEPERPGALRWNDNPQ